MSGLTDADQTSLCTCPWGADHDFHTFACSQRIRAAEVIATRAVNEALTEAAERIEEARSSHVYRCGCTECRISERAARIVRARTT